MVSYRLPLVLLTGVACASCVVGPGQSALSADHSPESEEFLSLSGFVEIGFVEIAQQAEPPKERDLRKTLARLPKGMILLAAGSLVIAAGGVSVLLRVLNGADGEEDWPEEQIEEQINDIKTELPSPISGEASPLIPEQPPEHSGIQAVAQRVQLPSQPEIQEMPRSEFPTVIQPDTQTVESETVESEIVESESSALEVTPSDPSPLNHASATPPETSPGSEASKDNGFKHFAPNVLDSQIRTEIPEDQANPTQPPRPQLPALPAQTQQPQIPPPNPPQPIHHSAFSSPPQSAPEPTLESLRDIPLPRLDSQLPSQFEAHYGSMDQIEQLILSIQSSDPAIRSKAIWELGQHSDSRAIQPLVDLLVGSDSKQRSLILAALSEIGSRALKPMNRALTFSLQDENAEVRKNAIRDLTRVYDLILQMSQLLQRAVYDPDPDVQETAEWAIDKLSRIRPLPIADRKRE